MESNTTPSTVPPAKVGQTVTGSVARVAKPKSKLKITPQHETVGFDCRVPTLDGLMQLNLSVAQAHDLLEALEKLLK